MNSKNFRIGNLVEEMERIEDYNKGIEAIEFLRDAIAYLDNRPETENEDKTPSELLNNYQEALNGRSGK